MKKHLLLLILAAGLLLPSCGSEPAPQAETSADTDSVAAENTAFVYNGGNYTFTPEKAVAAKTAPDIFTEIPSAAFYEDEILKNDFAAQLHVTLDSAHSEAGILFRAKVSEVYDGFEGYAFTIQDRRIYLHQITGSRQSGMKITELANHVVERPKRSEGCTLRVERFGRSTT